MRHLIWLLLLIVFGQGQVLKVSVDMEYAHLTDDQQEDLTGLASKIEQYFNNYEWVDDEFETDIPASVKVIIETVQKKTFEKIYKAQFLISSAAGENFYDKVWEFTYEPTYPLLHSKGQFDPLTHFLDYYAYLVLAGELDTFGYLLGSPLYDKALDIANQGILSQYSRGWNTRAEQVQMINHIRTRPLREVKPDYFEALWLHEEGRYNEAYKLAKKVLDEGIKKVYDKQPNNRYLRIFLDAHYRELANLFSGHPAEIEVLLDIDSKHRETYRQYLE